MSAVQPDVGAIARRAVVAIAAAAALVGILAGRDVLTVAWRAGVVALVLLVAIRVVERFTTQARGGAR